MFGFIFTPFFQPLRVLLETQPLFVRALVFVLLTATMAFLSEGTPLTFLTYFSWPFLSVSNFRFNNLSYRSYNSIHSSHTLIRFRTIYQARLFSILAPLSFRTEASHLPVTHPFFLARCQLHASVSEGVVQECHA